MFLKKIFCQKRKLSEILRYFRENFRYLRNFRQEIFAKSENKFSRNFRENTKTKF